LNIPDLAKFIQNEEVSGTDPCSESLFQKIGGSINYIIDYLTQPSVGSIEASVLTLGQFQSARGTGWVLADGANVTGSRYASLKSATLPDLRGYYIRGRGYNRTDPTVYNGPANPDGDTPTGTVQTDAVAAHQHFNHTSPNGPSDFINFNAFQGLNQNGSDVYNVSEPMNYAIVVTSEGDSISKPISVQVNFFIRIN
jgi:hypothetical protein